MQGGACHGIGPTAKVVEEGPLLFVLQPRTHAVGAPLGAVATLASVLSLRHSANSSCTESAWQRTITSDKTLSGKSYARDEGSGEVREVALSISLHTV